MSEMETNFVRIIERTAEICFDGKLPARGHDTEFLAAIMSVLEATTLENASPQVVAHFAFNLAQALDAVRREREARWLN